MTRPRPRPTMTATRTTTRPEVTAPAPLRPAGLLPAASRLSAPLRASGLAPASLTPFTPLRRQLGGYWCPSGKGASRRNQHVFGTRRVVILPTFGPKRGQPVDRLVVPLEVIAYVYEWDIMAMGTYTPGFGMDFDELAEISAENDDYGYGSVCDHRGEQWCTQVLDEGSPEGGRHYHWMHASVMDPDSTPLELVELDQPYVDPTSAMTRWKDLLPEIREARDTLECDPDILLEDDLRAGALAADVLRTAGYELPAGLFPADQLANVIRENLDSDKPLMAAFLDLGVTQYGHLCPEFEPLAIELAKAREADFYLREPDFLQFLTFDPAEFPPIGDRSAVQVKGSFTAVDATYHSVFDSPFDKHGWEWLTGWREVQMKQDT